MKLKLIESKLFEKFDPSFEIEYDPNDLVEDTDDQYTPMYGVVTVTADDVFYDIWDFIDSDPNYEEIISDDLLSALANDDAAWLDWVLKNYSMLIERYKDKFEERYFDKALDVLATEWDDHCDEPPYDPLKSAMKEYNELVAAGLKLR